MTAARKPDEAKRHYIHSLFVERVSRALRNPTITAHTHGVTALILFVSGRLEHRYGVHHAVAFHCGLFHEGKGSAGRLGSIITSMVGVGAVRSCAAHWLGGMEYHEIASVVLPEFEKARYTSIAGRVPRAEEVDDEVALLMHEIGLRIFDGEVSLAESY